MKTKFVLSLLLSVCVVFCFSGNVFAYPSVGDYIQFAYDGGNANGGGAFQISPSSEYPSVSFTPFSSFCLERDEYIDIGDASELEHDYFIWNISKEAIAGGVNTDEGDPLDPKTAYLYNNYLTGAYSGYADQNQMKNELQWAIWYIEEEVTFFKYTGAKDFYTEAKNAVLSGAWSGLGNIRVLNIGRHSIEDLYRQDMLVAVPEPTTILLSGLGLLGMGALLRRKYNK